LDLPVSFLAIKDFLIVMNVTELKYVKQNLS
jgi:hypothetical protein